MNILNYIVVLIGLYLFLWTVVYSVLMKFDFNYYWDYLWLSWISPGEIPAYIQMYSVSLTVFFVLVFISLCVFRRGKKRDEANKN